MYLLTSYDGRHYRVKLSLSDMQQSHVKGMECYVQNLDYVLNELKIKGKNHYYVSDSLMLMIMDRLPIELLGTE